MKTLSKTYRIFTALVLMLLFSTIAVPATISAASLFCNMELSSMHGPVQACCKHLNVDDINNESVTKTNSDCSFQKACEQTISDSRSEIQAIQQITKENVALVLTGELYSLSDEKQQQHQINHERPVVKESTPIFLLNNTFLN